MVLYEKKFGRTCLSILLVVVCLMTSLLFLYINVKADTIIRTGIVEVANSLTFRKGPGKEYGVVGYLSNGDSGTIIGEETATTGRVWYNMVVDGREGWASSAYVRVEETVLVEDGDFDAYLDAQGFPESYKAPLQALHATYPNWVFEAQHTNLDWDAAINGESVLGRNLVHSSAPTSWKSTQSGAYNWETGDGEWVVFDSGGWVAASTEVLRYFMDPRNFLDDTNIFQFIKQSYRASSLNATQLANKKTDLTNMVSGTYLANTCPGTSQSYVDVIMNAAKESGVCPFTLASMMIQEQGAQGYGSSISGTVPGYEGYYNYLNIGAYKTSTMSAVQRGLWFASGSGNGYTSYQRPWTNATRSITGGAIYYGESYVKVGQDTLYLKKFNVQGSNLYGHQYMTNVQGAASEGTHMAKAYDANARKAALVFRIPVYKNMPKEACTKPVSDDNPNYMLKSLYVAGYNLTPTFSMYETSYSLIVPNEVTSVTIGAEALATTAAVSGQGVKNLQVGNNDFSVSVTAQNGTVKTYVISIVREAAVVPEPVPEGPNASSYPVTSSKYTVDNSSKTVAGIKEFPIKASDFKAKLTTTGGSIKITTANGTEKAGTNNVGTGDQVRVYDASGVHQSTYTVVVYGDVSGDGSINSLDLLRIQKHILSISRLSGVYKSVSDTNRDGKITSLDLLQVQKHILKMKAIQQ